MHGVSKICVLACDINPRVIEMVIPRLTPECDVRAIDFLQLDPASTGLFNAVLTNPPFTRNHSIDFRRRAALRARFGASGAAGLWVHFLLHALDFLMPGGRLAAVIPASGLFSDYGRAALDRVCRRFAHVELREFVDKPLWVNDAEERGALLLAEGFNQGASALPRATRWSVSGQKIEEIGTADAVFNSLSRQSKPLDALATLSIGAVTGCNEVFLMNDEERRSMGIDQPDLRTVASRSRHIPGLSIDAATLIAQAQTSEKTWLLAPRSIDAKGGGVRRQLAKISAKRRRCTRWFSKRTPWWKVEVPPCNAIFTYMNDRGPRLVLTDDTIGCTNTLHCVRFAPKVSRAERMAASLSLQCTFGQLAAERIGRSYGGGVLKFELKEARQMPVLPISKTVEESYAEADRALRHGEHDVATRIADESLVTPLLGRNWRRQIEEMRVELTERRRDRRGER